MLFLLNSSHAGCFTPAVGVGWVAGPTLTHPCWSQGVSLWLGEGPVYGSRTRRSGRGIYLVSSESPAGPAAESPLISVLFTGVTWQNVDNRQIWGMRKGVYYSVLSIFYEFETFFCFFLNIIIFLGRSFVASQNLVLEQCPCRKQGLVEGTGLELKSSGPLSVQQTVW